MNYKELNLVEHNLTEIKYCFYKLDLITIDMESFLTEYDADGVLIITFFHRQFNEVLRERYKLDEGQPDENKEEK